MSILGPHTVECRQQIIVDNTFYNFQQLLLDMIKSRSIGAKICQFSNLLLDIAKQIQTLTKLSHQKDQKNHQIFLKFFHGVNKTTKKLQQLLQILLNIQTLVLTKLVLGFDKTLKTPQVYSFFDLLIARIHSSLQRMKKQLHTLSKIWPYQLQLTS